MAAGFLKNHKPSRPMAVVKGYVVMKKSRQDIAMSDKATGTSTNTMRTACLASHHFVNCSGRSTHVETPASVYVSFKQFVIEHHSR